jgi:hypothetical protein
MNNINITYDENYKLFECKATGIIDVDDFLDLIDYLKIFSKTLNHLKILLDLRESRANYKIVEQFKIVESFMGLLGRFLIIRIADIVNTPQETSYAILFKNEVSHIPKLSFEIFFTQEAALSWLNE